MLWKKSLREALTTTKDLRDFFGQDFAQTPYPILIPIKLAEKIRQAGLDSPLARQFLPSDLENILTKGLRDPIGDLSHQKNTCGVHRYQNRMLFIPTTHCPVRCRFCFRKNILDSADGPFNAGATEDFFQYLREHAEVEEVIFTGGDPFILDDQKLNLYLESLAKISSVRYVRFHTRTPVVLPERITPAFCQLLETWQQRFPVITVALHLNHVSELDNEVEAALGMLRKTGVQLLSHTVLLRTINDNVDDLKNLFMALTNLHVRPYYLHHTDQALATEHFWPDLTRCQELYHQLRRHIPGWALPHYVIDLPGGGGKINAANPAQFIDI